MREKRTRGRKDKKFGHLAFSVRAGNVPQGAIEANDRLTAEVRALRQAKGYGPDANVAVHPGMPSRYEVESARRAAEAEARKAARRQAVA